MLRATGDGPGMPLSRRTTDEVPVGRVSEFSGRHETEDSPVLLLSEPDGAPHPDAVTGVPFHIHVRPRRDRVVVAPEGELDLATAAAVDAQLRELRESGFERLVLDLRGLSFMDSSGIQLLVRWTRDAAHDECEFAVVRGGGPVDRILQLTTVGDLLTVVEPREIER
jgi:anti-anti-sigma factor